MPFGWGGYKINKHIHLTIKIITFADSLFLPPVFLDCGMEIQSWTNTFTGEMLLAASEVLITVKVNPLYLLTFLKFAAHLLLHRCH